MLVSKKTLSFMKLLSGPCLWLNPDGPFLHKGLHPFHTVLIFLVMMNHVLQMISYKLSQSSVSFLTHNPSHMEKAFVQGKGKVSFHGNLLLFTYYVQNDNFFILARQTKKSGEPGICLHFQPILPAPQVSNIVPVRETIESYIFFCRSMVFENNISFALVIFIK